VAIIDAALADLSADDRLSPSLRMIEFVVLFDRLWRGHLISNNRKRSQRAAKPKTRLEIQFHRLARSCAPAQTLEESSMPCLPSLLVAAAAAIVTATIAHAEGDLEDRPQKLPDLAVTTDKAYRLKITSTGNKPCAWEAPTFTNFVWRKIEVSRVEIKASHFYEIEKEREGEAEMYFVPIRSGEYAWGCQGLDGKGMAGKFIVK
jgi:hypothetical protein